MTAKTDKIAADLQEIITANDHDRLAKAAMALHAKYQRQTRQLDRLIRLSDANAEKLVKTNERLATLTANLSRFVPKTVVDKLQAPDSPRIAHKERRELTVFFSDIVGFTGMTERMEPEDLASLLVDYFTEMTRVCERWGGTLDQFIGDAILIFFGAPESVGREEDAKKAVGMALEMQEKLATLRTKWIQDGHKMPLHVRMGISTGFATVGNFGSDRRMHYTAIGNAVNEAARIQGLCAPDSLLIGAGTYLQVRDSYVTKAREEVRLRGQQQPVYLYEVEPHQLRHAPEFITGSGDGYRIFVAADAVSDSQDALNLLKEAIRHLERRGFPKPRKQAETA